MESRIFTVPVNNNHPFPPGRRDFSVVETDFLPFEIPVELPVKKSAAPKLEEEEEDTLLNLLAKLYRFDKDEKQWKQRGVGVIKLLKHKQTEKVRLVMRQAMTMKVCANHLVLPTISIQEHPGRENSLLWHANDFSDGELKEEVFCAQFSSIEDAIEFKQVVLSGKKHVSTNKERMSWWTGFGTNMFTGSGMQDASVVGEKKSVLTAEEMMNIWTGFGKTDISTSRERMYMWSGFKRPTSRRLLSLK